MPLNRISFPLVPVPPFRLDLTVWALRRRPHNLIDTWDGRTYRRVFLWRDQPAEVEVVQAAPPDAPELAVTVRGSLPRLEAENFFTRILSQMLGLELDLAQFYRFADRHPPLGALAERWRGFRPPRFPTLFEALVNGIACQQISLEVGIHLLNRLSGAYGPARMENATTLTEGSPASPVPHPVSFPRPQDLAVLDLADLRRLGFSRNKARAMIELARLTALGAVKLEVLEYLDEEMVRKILPRLLGVGRWTAEYVLLRGLGRWRIFPGDDVGARHILARWLNLSEPLDYESVRRLLQPWQPYAGLTYFLFLLESLAADGLVSPSI